MRRWLAGICLALALLMLGLGLTVLAPSLQAYVFLVYWLVCTCLTLLAGVIALADVMLLKRHLRNEQRSLIEDTLRGLPKDGDDTAID
jgi:hypothetical protein